jgi:hypothetical protein
LFLHWTSFGRTRYIVKVRRASGPPQNTALRPARAASAILLAAAALALASCGRLVVLAADPWWSAVSDGSQAMSRQVAFAVLRRGYLPSFVAVAVKEDAGERLLAALSRRRHAVAVLGPPLSFDAGAIAARFPDVTFVLVGGSGADDGIANTVQLVFDRTDAFRAAGALAAAAGPVAVLSAGGRPERETAAFTDGVISVTGAPAPAPRELSDPPGLDELKAAVAGLRDSGAAVFLYRPNGSGAAFLDVLAAAGGSAVVEGWAASRPRPLQVLASIEEDLPAGIAACLARGAAPVVTVPAILVRGEAAPGVRGAGERR